MEHKYRIEVSEGGVFAASSMGYKPHEPRLGVLFPEATKIDMGPNSISYLTMGNVYSMCTESKWRFDIGEKCSKKRAEPSGNGSCRRLTLEAAGSEKEAVLRMLDELAERANEELEFDQRIIMPLEVIHLRMGMIMMFYRKRKNRGADS